MAMAAANDITDKAPIDWIWRTPQKDALAVQRALDYISETLKVEEDRRPPRRERLRFLGQRRDRQARRRDYGLEIVATESYKTDDTDLTAQLTKIKGANPEVLDRVGHQPRSGAGRQEHEAAGHDIPYVGSHGIANKTFIELAGDAAEGVVFPAGSLLVPSSITDPEQKEVTDEFISAYKANVRRVAQPVRGLRVRGRRACWSNAIEKAGSTDAGGHPDGAQRHPGLRRPGRHLQLLRRPTTTVSRPTT